MAYESSNNMVCSVVFMSVDVDIGYLSGSGRNEAERINELGFLLCAIKYLM